MTVNVKKRWLNSHWVLKGLEWLFWGELVVLDQVSKWNAQMKDAVVMNHGGVFGIYPSMGWGVFLLLIWLLLFKYWLFFRGNKLTRWALGFIVMGGLGNIIDRMLFGAVRDFIYYPSFGFYGNIADIYLVTGVVMTIMIELHHEIQT